MFLSALSSLTDGFDLIASLPQKLNLEDGQVQFREVSKNGIVCKQVKIIDLNIELNHEHNHHHHGNHHHHSHEHHHHHLTDYVKMGWNKVAAVFGHHHHHGDHHHHRGLDDIIGIIDGGDISDNAKKIAKEIFLIVGESESRIHNIPVDKIHFHELSGVDSILDIVGCAVLLDLLKVEKTYCDPICTGFGNVKTQHGLLPIPAPATKDIVKGMPVYKGKEPGEKLTPTGAAVLKYLKPSFDVPVTKSIRVAYGPGEKDFRYPNVIRLSIVEKINHAVFNPKSDAQMIMIDCNVDDGIPEYLGSDFQRDLLRQGAIDFYFTSAHMKKGRPGVMLSVLTTNNNLEQVSDYILNNTSTIGVRHYPVSRITLPRKNIIMDTKYGPVNVKEAIMPSGKKKYKIEFDSILEIKNKNDLNLTDLQHELYVELLSMKEGKSG